jgi:hypothetical protein
VILGALETENRVYPTWSLGCHPHWGDRHQGNQDTNGMSVKEQRVVVAVAVVVVVAAVVALIHGHWRDASFPCPCSSADHSPVAVAVAVVVDRQQNVEDDVLQKEGEGEVHVHEHRRWRIVSIQPRTTTARVDEVGAAEENVDGRGGPSKREGHMGWT